MFTVQGPGQLKLLQNKSLKHFKKKRRSQSCECQKEKIQTVTEYSLVIVGSGIQMGRWTSDPEDFLKKHKKDLASKKLALFVNCGSAAEKLNPDKPEIAANAKSKYLEEKAAKYNFKPTTLGLFRGYL